MRNADLKEALADHLEETRFHVARVESAFTAAGIEALSARSAPLAGLMEQQGSQQVKEPTLADLLHAGAAVRVEHLELAIYEAVIGLARELDLDESAELLEQNRSDEDAALTRVSRLAAQLRSGLPR